MSRSDNKLPAHAALLFDPKVVTFRASRMVSLGGQNGKFAMVFQRRDPGNLPASRENVIKVTLPEEELEKLLGDLQRLLEGARLVQSNPDGQA